VLPLYHREITFALSFNFPLQNSNVSNLKLEFVILYLSGHLNSACMCVNLCIIALSDGGVKGMMSSVGVGTSGQR
jgi:hypothetical protein